MLWGLGCLAFCPPGHHQTCVYWHGVPTGIVNCCQQGSLCDAIIIILPASITHLPTTNTNTCSGWLHPLGRSAFPGVICRPIQWLGWVCVWTTNEQKWRMVATESLQDWLGTFGVHKEISNDGDNLQTSCSPSLLSTWVYPTRPSAHYTE